MTQTHFYKQVKCKYHEPLKDLGLGDMWNSENQLYE